MLIMIVFLILTVIFVIATIIYLNRKKKNSIANITTKEKHRKRRRKQLADILEIEIKDNVICLGNRCSMVVQLGSIDYNMLSTKEQEAVESVLIQTALTIDYPIQFFSTTEYIDTSKIISYMLMNKVSNGKVLEYRNYLIEYLSNLMENRNISIIKNYAVVSYDGLYENAVGELHRQIGTLQTNLRNAKITCDTLEEKELYDLLHRELNKNSVFKVSELMGGGLYVGEKQKEK